MRRLRAAILAVTLATALAGWAWQSPTLVALALVVAAEEMLEAAVVIGALRGSGLRRP
jgi:hypothetical protein